MHAQQCAYLQLIWILQSAVVTLLLISPAYVRCGEPTGRRLQDYVSRSIARSARLGKHTSVTQAAQEDLPIGESHPHIVSTGAAGLAKGCCTYSERYDVYKDFTKLHGTSWDPNIEIPDSNYTVIMRVHHGLKWSEDLRLSVRAMMTECRRAGLHFWLLHQDSSSNVPDSNARPTNFILDCPEEVRSIVRTFTAATVHGAYPLLHKFDDPHLRDYLTYLTFLRRYPGYKFAWVLESDVRYTGPDWGSLLNSMLNIAAASLMGTNFQDFDSSLATLPASDVELPDLVLMSHQEIPSESPITSKWAPRDIEHWRFQNLISVLVNLWGMSRQYIDILHELSVEGNGGYVEDFIATMAVEEKLSIVSMPHAEYGGFSFHCCIPDGTRYYTDWYLTGECRNYALNHPMKNDNESI